MRAALKVTPLILLSAHNVRGGRWWSGGTG